MTTKLQKIVPAVLEKNLEMLYLNFNKLLQITNHIHIDYVDDTFNNAFNYTIVDIDTNKINEKECTYELHYLSNKFDELLKFLHNCERKPSKVIIHLSEISKLEYSHQEKLIDDIKKISKLSIAINPDECFNNIFHYLKNHKNTDDILIMTVTPGKQNTEFLNNQYLNYFLNNGMNVNVDGGININTIDKIDKRVKQYIVGSYIIKSKNIQQKLNELQNKIDNF